jgi:hypothetical protein
MAQAATNFLASLNAEQRSKAVFELKDEERVNWHFIPRQRKGLPFKEMTEPQQKLAKSLLSSGLSTHGLQKAETIMSLEKVLYELENHSPTRDSERYFFSIFGTPGHGVWGWRFEGHHVSLNYAVEGDEVLGSTPSFFGANPAKVLEGPRKGFRTFAAEEDLGRSLIKSLDDEQRKIAIVTTEAPHDVVTGNSRKASPLEPMGISADKLNPAQKKGLMDLLNEYVRRYRTDLGEQEMKKILSKGEQNLHFAWAGGMEPGQGHYYRIQGPTFLVEYDDTQNDANHIHTVWRDFEHDFGGDVLLKHYKEEPHS